jgi:hypothetical protein
MMMTEDERWAFRLLFCCFLTGAFAPLGIVAFIVDHARTDEGSVHRFRCQR